jgi:hypothetical protein
MAIFRRGVENVCTRARKEAFKMGLFGLLGWLLIVPVVAIFAITIIGIPVAILLVLAFFLALLFGFIGVSYAIGNRLGNGHGRSIYISMAMGVIALYGLVILAGLIGLPGGALHMIGRVIAFIGWAIIFVAVTVGLGSVIMSKFGTSELKPKPAVPAWNQQSAGQGGQAPPSAPAGGQGPETPPTSPGSSPDRPGVPPQGTP